MKTHQTYTTDWINSNPVFYNLKTSQVSTNLNHVVDWGSLAFYREGLANYLKFGYLVFDKTPIKDVYRLPPNSTIHLHDSLGKKTLQILTNEDPVLKSLEKPSTPEECLNKIREHVQKFESAFTSSSIILPLSGGHDSRMLLSMISDKSKIKAVTYDISMSQSFSSETILAQWLAAHFKFAWTRLNLKKYFTRHYVRRNFLSFGLEMPIHASYHMEMYDLAKQIYGTEHTVFSGSVGDWWSGEKVPLTAPEQWQDAEKLFFNHGISIPQEHILIKADPSYNESQILPSFELVRNSRVYRSVFSRRGRVGLSGFIMRVAESAFPAYTPFYDIQVALSQLNLPETDRHNRIWQKEYFDRIGMGIGLTTSASCSMSYDCSQDLQAAHNAGDDFTLLDSSKFDNIVCSSRIAWINAQIEIIKTLPISFISTLSNQMYSSDNQRTIRSNSGQDLDAEYTKLFDISALNKAICEWTVLMPIQLALEYAEDSQLRLN